MGKNRLSIQLPNQSEEAEAWIHLIDSRSPLVVFDIDGTVTSSDLAGHLGAAFDVPLLHPGVCEFACILNARGYHLLFLTARGLVGPAGIERTRRFLFEVARDAETGFGMPFGAVMTTSHTSTGAALYDEVIVHASGAFKEETLRVIRSLFDTSTQEIPRVTESGGLIAGFGNKKTDAEAYVAASIPPNHVFIVNTASRITRWGSEGEAPSKMEATTWKSYLGLLACIDEEFPRISNEADALQILAQHAARAAERQQPGQTGRGYKFDLVS